MINPATGWFDIFEIPTYDLEKSSTRVSQLFNNTWLLRYPRPRKVLFDNRSGFKQYFNPLLKHFGIKSVLTTIKNPQHNALVERVRQVVLNMLFLKYIDNKIFDHIYPRGETLASIAWAVIASY